MSIIHSRHVLGASEINLKLTISGQSPDFVGTWSPNEPLIVSKDCEITITLEGDPLAKFLDCACTGVVQNPNNTSTSPLSCVIKDRLATLTPHLLSGQMIDFGMVVQIGDVVCFFDPQATNDPR